MTEKFLIIRFDDGRTGAVLESGLVEHADNFKGAHIISYEDGTEWSGPSTAEGVARRAAAAVEARREARRERQEAREAVRQAEVEVETVAEEQPAAKE